MSPATAILIMGLVALVVAIGGLIASALLSPSKKNKAKTLTYECGIDPFAHDDGQGRFPVKYYLVAMTFIVFDVEMVFLYPWAVSIAEFGKDLAIPALIAMLSFITLITVPYIYEWRRGGLDY